MTKDNVCGDRDYPYLGVLADSLRDVLLTMALVEVRSINVRPLTKDDVVQEVAAIMRLPGSIKGCVMIGTTRDVATEVVDRITGRKPGELTDDDIREGIGEVLNMTAGNAKARLVDTPYHFAMSTPVLVAGDELSTCSDVREWPIGGAVFEVDGGRIVLAAEIEPAPDA